MNVNECYIFVYAHNVIKKVQTGHNISLKPYTMHGQN